MYIRREDKIKRSFNFVVRVIFVFIVFFVVLGGKKREREREMWKEGRKEGVV